MSRFILLIAISSISCGLSLPLNAWTTVTVHPPPSSCRDTWTSNNVCNPLQAAVNTADDYTKLVVQAGEYYNKDFMDTSNRTSLFSNPWLLQIQSKRHLAIEGAVDSIPLLRFDGAGGISIKDSEHLSIQGLEIQGPSDRISGSEASAERVRQTSRAPDGSTTGQCSRSECSSCDESQCISTEGCKYTGSACQAKTLGYFNGRGIAIWAGTVGSHHVNITNCTVHHAPASGIRANKADEVYISDNIVYDNIWWTTSAESAIVFADSAGTGSMAITSNVVYGNRNFMPFYSASLDSLPGQTGSAIGHYAGWDQDYIIDGSGVYISRNQEYEGTFILEGNTAFDNGINGVVVHNTNNPSVQVMVKDNIVFSNGKTTKDVESRQEAGGITINSGVNVHLEGNIVSTAVDGDFGYQCFGTCHIAEGHGNTACTPANIAPEFTAFATQSSSCQIDQAEIRARYPTSSMPASPQYEHFPPAPQDGWYVGSSNEQACSDVCTEHQLTCMQPSSTEAILVTDVQNADALVWHTSSADGNTATSWTAKAPYARKYQSQGWRLWTAADTYSCDVTDPTTNANNDFRNLCYCGTAAPNANRRALVVPLD